MKPRSIVVAGAGLLLITACSSSDPSTTTAGTSPAPASSNTAKSNDTSTIPTKGSDKTTPGTTKKTTKGTTGGTTLDSRGAPVELNTWKVDSSKGPFEKDFAAGGTVFCTYNSKGNVWSLKAASKDAKFGNIDLLFEDPAKPNEAKVSITTPGNKDTLGEGTAKLTITDAGNNIFTFGAGLSYRATAAAGGASGELQVTGSCHQEQKPKQK